MPWLQDADVMLYHGDVLAVLPELPAESVDCVVTSPPYWGLRDYGTGAWEGGDTECDHLSSNYDRGVLIDASGRTDGGASVATAEKRRTPMKDTCGKCGATRIDQQLGLEPTPEQYVERMVEVFREVRRVLAPHGTVWLNLGDSYTSTAQGQPSPPDLKFGAHATERVVLRPFTGLKPKDLVGIPWRVAFALQADGWYLRSDIVWSKPNPMPESVTDRPTKAHEYVFLLSKNSRYFFDQEAVREAWQTRWMPGARTSETHHYGAGNGGNTGLTAHRQPFMDELRRQRHDREQDTLDGSEGEADRGPDGRRKTTVQGADGSIQHRDGERWPNGGRNIRSVWEIATQPYPEAHFATFPEELARRCIAAGTSEKGKCPNCGKPWVREVKREIDTSRPLARQNIHAPEVTKAGQGTNAEGSSTWGHYLTSETVGWSPSCSCVIDGDRVHVEANGVADELARAHLASAGVVVDGLLDGGGDADVDGLDLVGIGSRHEPSVTHLSSVPCVVLDPFMGSGTVAHVARKLGRHAVGIDLNAEYLALAARRLQQQSLFAEMA